MSIIPSTKQKHTHMHTHKRSDLERLLLSFRLLLPGSRVGQDHLLIFELYNILKKKKERKKRHKWIKSHPHL